MRGLLLGAAMGTVVGLATPAMAQVSNDTVKIGVLTDMTGNLSALSGKGSLVAAQMAVEDFGGKVLGKPIEVLSADHQNKADIGSQIANKWIDVDNVDMIVDAPNSSVALAVQAIAKQKNRVFIASAGGTAELTGKSCSPTGMQWTWDTYAAAVSTARAIVEEGGKSWFFLTADYAFGKAMEADVSRVVQKSGGTIAGQVRHPTNTSDFSSFLLQAQASKADVIALANGGSDTSNSLKQAQEFGLTKTAKIAALAIFITDVHAVGPQQAQGLLLTTGFYWDRTDATRAWSQKFFQRHGAMPTMSQAGVYSAVMHYLKAIDAAKTDGAMPVVAKMKATKVNDMFAENGVVREDGRMVHDMYLVQVKAPADVKKPWDYYKVLRTVKGDDAFRPLAESECPLVKK
ncbi:MAG: ABC transporter substrate-binding protein [Rhizobiales bacterium]|nr:ABC transporter substrate-binding protein [Hyphomicrobiales bacterium]OJY42051.1 MAG: ABC transporter permease [Rhizobiales bacterium 64-17]